MYTATDLGKLPYGGGSVAAAVNDSGRIVGSSQTPDGHWIAVMWAQPGSQPLPIMPSSYDAVNSWAAAINSSGQIVGSFTDKSGQEWPYLYNSKSGVFEVIGSNVNLHASPIGINQKGTVLLSDSFHYRFFTYDGTTLTLLPSYSRPFFIMGVNAINDFGDLAGQAASEMTGSDVLAVIYNAATSSWISTYPNSYYSGLTSINNEGWAVGYRLDMHDMYNWVLRPMVASKTVEAFTPTLPSTINISRFTAVNDAGLALSADTLFAYDIPSDAWIDLKTKIVNPGVIRLAYAYGISRDGKIVGSGYVNLPGGESEQHAFLLTPTPLYKATSQPPIKTDGSSTFSAARGVVPVKFALTENDSPTCTLPSATISVSRTSGATYGLIDVSTYQTPTDNGSNFRIDSCQYTYVLGTKALGPGKYRADMIINWNIVGSGEFAIK
jgi:uncharacterized membrane protein